MKLRIFIFLLAMAIILSGFSTSNTFAGSKGCNGFNTKNPPFSAPKEIFHPYLPLVILEQNILEGTQSGEFVHTERTKMTGTLTFTIPGNPAPVETLIVQDREFINGKLYEIATDYFAQSDCGTVYYLGEDVDTYDPPGNPTPTGHEGSWRYGRDTNQLGILIPGFPSVGQTFQAENVPGITREDDKIVSVNETVTVPAGTFRHCVKTREKHSDGEIEYKYYAPCVGVIKESPADGSGDLDLVSSKLSLELPF